MRLTNGKRSQLGMEREHNAPFISVLLLRAEMVKGMSWHRHGSEHKEALVYDRGAKIDTVSKWTVCVL